jgi:hypothetical protein
MHVSLGPQYNKFNRFFIFDIPCMLIWKGTWSNNIPALSQSCTHQAPHGSWQALVPKPQMKLCFPIPHSTRFVTQFFCPTPRTYCMDVSMRFLFGIPTPPVHAHWMTWLLNPEPHCLTNPLYYKQTAKKVHPKVRTTNFEIDQNGPF